MRPSVSNTGCAKPVEAESAAAFPAHGFGNAALFALDNLFQTRDAMRNGMVAHLDADIAAPHLVRDGSRRAESLERYLEQGHFHEWKLLKPAQ